MGGKPHLSYTEQADGGTTINHTLPLLYTQTSTTPLDDRCWVIVHLTGHRGSHHDLTIPQNTAQEA